MPNSNSKNSGGRRGRPEGGRNRSERPFNKSDRKGKSEEGGSRDNKSSSFGSKRPRIRKDSDAPRSGKSYGAPRGEKSSSGPRGGKSYGTSRDEKSFGGSRGDKGYGSSRGEKSSSGSRGGKSYGTSRDEKSSSGPRSVKSFGSSRGEKPSRAPRSKDDFGPPRTGRGTGAPGRRNADGKEKRNFEKGPSYGLPFKRKYDKGERDSSDGGKRSFSKDGDSRFKKYSSDKSNQDKGKSFGRKDESQGREGRNSSDKKFENRSRGKSFGRDDRSDKASRRKDSDNEEKSPFFKKSMSRYDKTADSKDETVAPAQTDKIRLNKYIANSGVCSRREADELITMSLITVNGKTITELGYKVNPGDEVRYENKVLKAEKPVYILMNKPKGYLTTTDDPQERNTVMHIIGGAVKERIYPVGRLDRNTTGLLLLTNDGDLADKLMHPSYNIKKIYKVELDRPVTKADLQKIADGVRLEEGVAAVDDVAVISEDSKTVGVEIHIGWNRVVRRIFEALGYEVTRLDRSVYAGLDKKDLGRGHWRFLTKEEIVRLKHYK